MKGRLTRRPFFFALRSVISGRPKEAAESAFSRRRPTKEPVLLAVVLLEEFGKFLFERRNLGAVADHDVGVAGIVQRVVLMVRLRVVEAFQGVTCVTMGFGKTCAALSCAIYAVLMFRCSSLV